jgi:signal transduction histidine kinase
MAAEGVERLGAFARTYWLEIAWVTFSLLNLAALFLVPSAETVPFHFVWVSLTLVYGIRLWRLRTTSFVLLGVMLGTGVALGWALVDTSAGFDELLEVPLMGAVFVTVMWHVYRRQAALDEVRRLADSERRLLERQRDLVRDASHELRTPITVARGHAELIRQNETGQAQEDAEIILDELDRLARISQRLLILAAAEHPEFLRRAPIDFEELIVDTARRWTVAAERQWRVEPPHEGVLYADEERLQAMLDALIENAVKFTDEGDRISIVGRGDDSTAVIEIADSGEGIEPVELPRIFDRFSRANGHPAANGGTGLGLAMVKAVAEAHGGTVEVRSGVGRGTTFSLRIPGLEGDAHGTGAPRR